MWLLLVAHLPRPLDGPLLCPPPVLYHTCFPHHPHRQTLFHPIARKGEEGREGEVNEVKLQRKYYSRFVTGYIRERCISGDTLEKGAYQREFSFCYSFRKCCFSLLFFSLFLQNPMSCHVSYRKMMWYIRVHRLHEVTIECKYT